MGISLETSGIKVGEDKCFLVNLNADPALNELLVYYLKVFTHHWQDDGLQILNRFAACCYDNIRVTCRGAK